MENITDWEHTQTQIHKVALYLLLQETKGELFSTFSTGTESGRVH